MPPWLWDRKALASTPSISDGLSPEVEARYRREGTKFIIDCGNEVGLPCATGATGAVFFHRFYMFHSFTEFPRHVTGAACLFLAGKVEETPKKCRDIVKVVKKIITEKLKLPKLLELFGQDPREEIMTYERVLLQTIKFDLQVEHPYQFIVKYAKQLKGDKDNLNKLVQMAWTFVNDSLTITLCIQWEPQVIAIAMLYLASRLSKLDIQEMQGKHWRGSWWDQFVEHISVQLLEDLCHQVLDLYSIDEATPCPSPPYTPPDPVTGVCKTTPDYRGTPNQQTFDETSNDDPKLTHKAEGGTVHGVNTAQSLLDPDMISQYNIVKDLARKQMHHVGRSSHSSRHSGRGATLPYSSKSGQGTR